PHAPATRAYGYSTNVITVQVPHVVDSSEQAVGDGLGGQLRYQRVTLRCLSPCILIEPLMNLPQAAALDITWPSTNLQPSSLLVETADFIHVNERRRYVAYCHSHCCRLGHARPASPGGCRHAQHNARGQSDGRPVACRVRVKFKANLYGPTWPPRRRPQGTPDRAQQQTARHGRFPGTSNRVIESAYTDMKARLKAE